MKPAETRQALAAGDLLHCHAFSVTHSTPWTLSDLIDEALAVEGTSLFTNVLGIVHSWEKLSN